MDQLYAIKRQTHQTWTKAGIRIPVTVLRTQGNLIVSKTETEQYLGFGEKKLKNTPRPDAGTLKKAGISVGIRMIRKASGTLTEQNVGEAVLPSSVFKPGDVVTVTGTSKGEGFAGGMKLHGFHGGPRTHGQSDRERAPGSSGSGTTPGRVFKGKRMAGRGGGRTVSIQNLMVVSVDDETGVVLVKGLVPGTMNSTVKITKTGERKFDGLFVKKTAAMIAAEIEAAEAALAAEKAAEAAEEAKKEAMIGIDPEKVKAEEKTEEVKTTQEPKKERDPSEAEAKNADEKPNSKEVKLEKQEANAAPKKKTREDSAAVLK